ncbi:hypothetical protein CROQUDRAFT_134354 [Cronartium quercuum f. sp. fusiforme G11]|uniref:MADS-box domain-containing protein n=1 Tax=Cronartium quercuum f. sp. fusiforme G11 TaxID=708437 RepID=A0A9P6NE65_9BASI|nr:hypothetical protein CROQUDRAFT_134354 [Cronartium quercuum f. sp. fusiforme G11]
MDPASGPSNSGPSRPKKSLPNTSTQQVKQESVSVLAPSDLGGTLVPQTAEELAELSTDSDEDDGGTNGSGAKRRKGKSKSNLPRRQIKIEYIQDKSRRNITFGKRKHGIFKKASEISVLTGCEVMLIVAPKDNEHQAFTFATAKLQPMVTDPAGEAFIQNCLRYGALMPGAPSGMTGAYGSSAPHLQGPLMSTLNMGPRGSGTTHHGPPSHAPMYPYGPTTSIGRRPPASYGLPHPLSSSPQSNGSASLNQPANHPSLAVTDRSKRTNSNSPMPHLDSPMPHLGQNNSNASSKVTWQTTGHPTVSDFHPVNSNIGGSGGSVGSSNDVLTDWNVPNARHMFQPSPSLTPTSAQSRTTSNFGMNSAAVAGMSYPNMNTGPPPFHRQSPDSSILPPNAWQGLPASANPVRAAPSTPGRANNSNTSNGNGPTFLEPLVLSQPYEHRSTSSDGPMSAGPVSRSNNHPVNMQPSLSQYGDHDHYDNICAPSAYLNDDGSDLEGRPYTLDTPDQRWPNNMH